MFHPWWLPRSTTLSQPESSSKLTPGGGFSWPDHISQCSDSCTRAADLLIHTGRTPGKPVSSQKTLQGAVWASLPEEGGISWVPVLQTTWGQGAEGLLSKEGNFMQLDMFLAESSSSHLFVICPTLPLSIALTWQAPDLCAPGT